MQLSDIDLTLKNICRKKERRKGGLTNRHLGQNLQVGLRKQSYRTYRAAEASSQALGDFIPKFHLLHSYEVSAYPNLF